MKLNKKRPFLYVVVPRSGNKRTYYFGPFKAIYKEAGSDPSQRKVIESDLLDKSSFEPTTPDEVQGCINFINENREMLTDQPDALDEFVTLLGKHLSSHASQT